MVLSIYIFGQKRATLTGLVKIQSSYQQPLVGVSISAEGCNSNISKSDGRFTLDCPSKDIGGVIYNIVAIKNGYEVVNDVLLENVTIPKEGEKGIIIVMCKKGEITFRKKQYYRIAEEGLTGSIKILTNKVNEINQGNKKDSLHYYKEQLNTVVHLLSDKEYLKKKAEEYAKIDLDEVDENYRKAFLLFTSGKISEANSIMNTNVILRNIELSKEKVKKASEEHKFSYVPLFLKADIQQRLGSVDSARILYEIAINYDTTNYESVLRLIYFFKSQREYKKANKWTENLKYTDLKNPLVRDATYYFILGDNSIIQHKNRLAREALERAKSLYLKIHPINQNTSIEYISFIASLDEKLAYVYRSQGSIDLAIPLLLNSLKINQDLVKRDSIFLFNLANSYTQLGKCFFRIFKMNLLIKLFFMLLKYLAEY